MVDIELKYPPNFALLHDTFRKLTPKLRCEDNLK